MAGDANAGGGGSVYWSVDVDRIDSSPVVTDCVDLGSGRYHQRGRDRDGDYGANFTVTIKLPDGFNSARDYLEHLKGVAVDSADGRFSFPLPIEDDPKQIRITWGDRVVAKHPQGPQGSRALLRRAGSTSRKVSAKKKSAKKKIVKKAKPSSRRKGR